MSKNAMIITNKMNTYKITPDFRLSNAGNEVITSSFANIYEKPINRTSIRGMNFKKPQQVYFDILIEKTNASFFLTIPDEYNDLIQSKVKSTWNNSAMEQVTSTEQFEFRASNTVGCELSLKDYNYHSLSTDLSSLNHMKSLFHNMKHLKDDEKILITIAIEPMLRKNWLTIVQNEIDKEKAGIPRQRQEELGDYLFQQTLDAGLKGIELYVDLKLFALDCIMGMFPMMDAPAEPKSSKKSSRKRLDDDSHTPSRLATTTQNSHASKKKVSEVAKVNISILSSSSSNIRAKTNLTSVAESLKELNDDNEFVVTEIKRDLVTKLQQIATRTVKINNKCILSTRELAKLIQLPQKTIQREYGLKAIDILEVDVPERLRKGNVVIGIMGLRGKKIPIYRDTDKSTRCLPWILVGGQNAGKTTFMKRIAQANCLSGDSNFVVDHLQDCKIAKACREVIPDELRFDIHISEDDMDNLPSFSFNEVSSLVTEDTTADKRLNIATKVADQIEIIINGITDKTTGHLTVPMSRYLYSASVIAFIKPNATLQDVFDILKKPSVRSKAINYALSNHIVDSDDDIILNLEQLNKTEKDENKDTYIVNNDSLIVGILNRLTTLERSRIIKKMLSNKPNPDENFEKLVEEGKSVVISIPQYDIPSKKTRDVLVSYYTSRLWLMTQLRKNNDDARPCHILLDEVYTIKGTMELMEESLTEFRRHRLGLLTSCHYLGQFGDVFETIKSASTSYVLLRGAEKQNALSLKEEILPFSVDDLLTLKDHHAIIIQQYMGGFANYIARIPDFGEK